MVNKFKSGNVPQVSEAIASSFFSEAEASQCMPATTEDAELEKKLNRHREIEAQRKESGKNLLSMYYAGEKGMERYEYVLDLSKKHWIDPCKKYPKPEFLLSFGNKEFLPLGDIVLLAGKPKAGKTHAMMVLAASMLGCKEFGVADGLANISHLSKVLWFDTEQSIYNAAQVREIVSKLAGLSPEECKKRFNTYSCRGMGILDMVEVIVVQTCARNPDLVVIDGVADLVENFNDVEQSSKIIRNLLMLTAKLNCAIVTMLHTNKENDNPKGHLGSLLKQKASDVLYANMEKGGIFSIKEGISRNGEFKGKICYTIDNNAVPHSVSTLQIEAVEKQDNKKKASKASKAEEERKLFAASFGDRAEMSYTELAKAYATVSNMSDSNAKRRIGEATVGGKNNKYGLLAKSQNEGKTVYSLLPESQSESENGGENDAENGGERSEPLKFDITVN